MPKEKREDRKRLLYILDILRSPSPETNLTAEEVLERCLGTHPTTINTVKEDLKSILEHDSPYNRITVSDRPKSANGRIPKAYSIPLAFTPGEYRILADLIIGTYFIPKDEAEALIKKLTSYAGESAEKSQQFLQQLEREHKTHATQTSWNASLISEALEHQKRLSFTYTRYGSPLKKVPCSKKAYEVSPIATKVENGDYYLYSYCHNREATRTFRIDRMYAVSVLDEPAIPTDQFDAYGYFNSTVKMYGGDAAETEVILEVQDCFIKNVSDEYANAQFLDSHEDGVSRIAIHVRPSNTFFAWIFQFDGGIRIKSPGEVIASYEEMLGRALSRKY